MSSSKNDRDVLPAGALPTWVVTGVLGLALGIGGTLIAVRGLGRVERGGDTASARNAASPPSSGGGASPISMSGGMGGMMGAMGGGNSPGASAKRSLTALVGKLDLGIQGISLQLTPEQSTKIAARIAELEAAEKMSGEDAEKQLASLEEILTEDQKSVLARFELPRGPRPAGGMGGMGGAGPPPFPADENDNPFRQETHQKRAQDLMARLGAAPTPSTASAPSASTPESP